MKYLFGPNNKTFNGSDEEWNKFKETNVLVKETKVNFITVKCPHCGATNTHANTNGHRNCDLRFNKKGKILYDCPGYVIKLCE